MERGENNPFQVLLAKTLATMYQWHNYGKSTIGARADVEGVDIGRLKDFYKLYYQPDNATLIVSGKFDPAAVLEQIQTEFGAIPAPKRALPNHYTLDPAQDGERLVTLRRVSGVPLILAAYHVPPGAHPDMAALKLIDLLMSDDPAGRLHQRLIDNKLAANVFAFSRAAFDPGMTIFGAQLAPGQEVDAAQAALIDVIESIAKVPFTDDEVNRARSNWLISWDRRFTDPEQIGLALSEYVALGDWRLFFLLRDRIKAVTTTEINRVAGTWLLRDNRTLAQYLPTEKPARAPVPQAVNLVAQLQEFKPVEAAATVASFEATPENIESRTRRAEIGPGLKVSLLPKDTRGNVVDAQLILRFGSVESLMGRRTAATLLPALLDKGTTSLSRQQVQDRQTALKSTINIRGDAQAINVSIQSTREHFVAMIELVGDLLRNPILPANALEEVRQQALSGIEQSRKEPQALVSNTLERYGNPYPVGDLRAARTFDELVADLQAVNIEQVREIHRQFLGASNAQFAAVGAMDEAAVNAALARALGAWVSKTPFERAPRPLIPLTLMRQVLETPDKQNAVLVMRQPLPIRELDPEQAALLVANFIVGSSSNSRLWTRIREKEGLSYDVRTQISFNPFETASFFSGSAIFAPSNRAKVERAFEEELIRVQRDGFTVAEIKEAKEGILNFRRLARAQDANLASTLAANAYLGRTFAIDRQVDDAITQVTPEQALSAWRKFIDPQRFVKALGGDFKGQ
jgi:zinc protease